MSEELKPVAWRLNANQGHNVSPNWFYFESFTPKDWSNFTVEPLCLHSEALALQSRIAELEGRNDAAVKVIRDLMQSLAPYSLNGSVMQRAAQYLVEIDAAIAAKEPRNG